jgi:hypothetical protein
MIMSTIFISLIALWCMFCAALLGWRSGGSRLTAIEHRVRHLDVARHSRLRITVAGEHQQRFRAVPILAIAARQQRRPVEAANFRKLHQMRKVLSLTSGNLEVPFRRIPVARRCGRNSGDGLRKA